MPVEAVNTKLLAEDCNNGVVIDVVATWLGAVIAPVEGLYVNFVYDVLMVLNAPFVAAVKFK